MGPRPMRRAATLLTAALLLSAGCVSKSALVETDRKADLATSALAAERKQTAELKRRVAELEAQLAEARRGQSAAGGDRDRLSAGLNAARGEIARLEGQLAEASDQRDTLARQLAIAQQATSEKDVNLQRLDDRYGDLIKDLERQRSDLSKRVTDLSGRLAQAESRVAQVTGERDRLAGERLTLDVRRQEAEAELGKTRNQLAEARTALNSAQADLTATRGRLKTAGDDLERMRGELAGMHAQLDAARADLASTGSQLAAANAELAGTRDQLGAATAELAGIRSDLASAAADLAATREALGQTREQLADRDRKLKESTTTYDKLVADLKGEIAEGQVRITRLRDKLTVNLVDKVLFDSGSVDIKPRGQEVLRKVAEVLKTVKDRRIQIEGHTDNIPIAGSLRARYPSNWELSAARATVVARFLEDTGGVSPALLAAVGYGEHHPVAGNDTPEGRAENRRIEIVLLPRSLDAALN